MHRNSKERNNEVYRSREKGVLWFWFTNYVFYFSYFC